MGRKESKRFADNKKVRELLQKDEWTKEEEEFIRLSYSGYGALNSSGSHLGQYFTPQKIVSFIHNLLDIPTGATVCEPSCGGGGFLNGLTDGVDIKACELAYEAAEVAQRLYPYAQIEQGDGLEFLEKHKESFNYIIGNPPYGSAIEAKSRFANKKGKVDPVVVFLEKGIEALQEGGILAMVVPDNILSDNKFQSFRAWALENALLLTSISLPTETFYFAGTSTKTSVIVLQKPVESIDYGDYPVMMAVCENVGWDSRGREISENDLPQILFEWKLFMQERSEHIERLNDTDIEEVDIPTPSLEEVNIVRDSTGQLQFDLIS
ncbi:type I restriction enzyme M protein [Evansella vedderi]|uniref:Type I restriction enzyme M protein n=1 Tax=Evansella vedderi TaxID=38282 RepID=A0ABT9ZYR3_9BACI|nr:N-6 DNA methylase [Evansella vedderi]MDQ0255578.1 type I restriction enzyme M protein [Evansella vedderi]